MALCAWILGTDVAFTERKSTKMKTTISTVVNICDVGTSAVASIACVVMAAVHAHLIARVHYKLTLTNTKLNIIPPLVLHGNNLPHLIAPWLSLIIIILYTSFLITDFILTIVMENNSYVYTLMYVFHYVNFTVELQIALIARKIKYLFNALNVTISKCLARAILRPFVLPPVETYQGKNQQSTKMEIDVDVP